jgi:hypothetical protein
MRGHSFSAKQYLRWRFLSVIPSVKYAGFSDKNATETIICQSETLHDVTLMRNRSTVTVGFLWPFTAKATVNAL